jgi:hypothetical protein
VIFSRDKAFVGTSVGGVTFRHARALDSTSVEGDAIPVGSFPGTGSSTISIYASTERISASETSWVQPSILVFLNPFAALSVIAVLMDLLLKIPQSSSGIILLVCMISMQVLYLYFIYKFFKVACLQTVM